MFSKACEYAIRCTVYIATNSIHDKRVDFKDVAQKIASPEAYTAKILQKLVQSKLINSYKGKGGGFSIDRGILTTLTIKDVVEAIDGNQTYNGCFMGLDTCNESHPCPLHYQYKAIKTDISNMISSTTIVSLLEQFDTGKSFLNNLKT